MKTNPSKFVGDGFARLIESRWYGERRMTVEHRLVGAAKVEKAGNLHRPQFAILFSLFILSFRSGGR